MKSIQDVGIILAGLGFVGLAMIFWKYFMYRKYL